MNNQADFITLRVPASTTVGSLKALAADLGCRLRYRPDGSFAAIPAHSDNKEKPHG